MPDPDFGQFVARSRWHVTDARDDDDDEAAAILACGAAGGVT
jgi:hypothetical protein